MKIRLEKPVGKKFKAYGWQKKKPRRGILREKLYLDF